jgi:hypothetical protein
MRKPSPRLSFQAPSASQPNCLWATLKRQFACGAELLSFPPPIRYNKRRRNTEAQIMRLLTSGLVAGVILGWASLARGQGQPQPQVPPGVPTTVQLPTFSFFTVQTTVSVPDSGGMSLGGINRATNGSTTRGFGPLQNRALSSTRGASGTSVHASIIDHHELDEAVLAEAAARRGATVDPVAAKAAALSRNTAGQASGGPAIQSLAAIREQNALAAAQQTREVAEYLAKAQQAEAEGKPGVAKIYYQIVLRKGAGVLQQQAQARLAAMNAGGSVAKR